MHQLKRENQELRAQLAEARREVDRVKREYIKPAFDLLKLEQERDASRAELAEARATAARLRAHIDTAGDGMNLCELLDLYQGRVTAAEARADDVRKEYSGYLKRQLAEQTDGLVCACGCSWDDHEVVDSEGFACEHDDHECIQCWPSVRTMLTKLRAQLADAERKVERFQKALRRVDCTIIDPVDYPGLHLAQARMMRGYARQALAQGGDPTEEPEQGEEK